MLEHVPAIPNGRLQQVLSPHFNIYFSNPQGGFQNGRDQINLRSLRVYVLGPANPFVIWSLAPASPLLLCLVQEKPTSSVFHTCTQFCTPASVLLCLNEALLLVAPDVHLGVGGACVPVPELHGRPVFAASLWKRQRSQDIRRDLAGMSVVKLSKLM